MSDKLCTNKFNIEFKKSNKLMNLRNITKSQSVMNQTYIQKEKKNGNEHK